MIDQPRAHPPAESASPSAHQRARELFDRTADRYLEHSDAAVSDFSSLVFQRRIETVEELIAAAPRRGQVLDFGMGPAVFGRFCVDGGSHYLGLDISPEMVRRAEELGLPNSSYAVGDLSSLSAHRDSADVVLAIGLVDYLEDPEEGLRTLAGCLRPGGTLIVSFRNRRSVPGRLRDLARAGARRVAGRRAAHARRALVAAVHEHAFDLRDDLAPVLHRLGLEVVTARYFNCSPMFFNVPLPRALWRAWRRLDRRIAGHSTRWMCSGAVLAARRPAPPQA